MIGLRLIFTFYFEMILDLYPSFRNSTENPEVLSAFPTVGMLMAQGLTSQSGVTPRQHWRLACRSPVFPHRLFWYRPFGALVLCVLHWACVCVWTCLWALGGNSVKLLMLCKHEVISSLLRIHIKS